MNRQKRIFLIGMMGSGKTSVGRRLAERLKMTFVDLDESLEKVTGKAISEIFREWGEEKFREMERAFFEEKSKQDNQVFSTGGGIVLDERNHRILRDQGVTILLKANPHSLARRIEIPTTRPLLKNIQFLENQLVKVWEERKDLYRSTAHLVIDTDDLSPDDVVEAIVDHLRRTDEND